MGKGVSVVFKKLSSVWLAGLLAAVGGVLATGPAVGAATIVVVTHDGQHGWHSRITDGNGASDPSFGSVTFVTGPGTPPRGVGSLRLQTNPGKGDGSAQMRNSNYSGTLLSNLTELTYYAYSAMNNGQQFPYLTFNVSCNGCSGGSTPNTDILFFEPPYQTLTANGNLNCKEEGFTQMFTWQQWDALHGCWWDNGGFANPGIGARPLSDFIAQYPDATIYNPATTDSPKGVGGVRFAVGFASPTDNFDGNVDMFTIGVQGNSTSYDFEPPPACQEADGNGDFHSQDGRHGNVQMDNDNCEESGKGGNGESEHGDSVSSSDRGDGKDFQSTNIESSQFDPVAGTVTITGVGTSGGSPVAFTLVAVQSSIASLGSVSMVFSDGYSITGDLVNGSISLS
jgi:hypothetical protein